MFALVGTALAVAETPAGVAPLSSLVRFAALDSRGAIRRVAPMHPRDHAVETLSQPVGGRRTPPGDPKVQRFGTVSGSSPL